MLACNYGILRWWVFYCAMNRSSCAFSLCSIKCWTFKINESPSAALTHVPKSHFEGQTHLKVLCTRASCVPLNSFHPYRKWRKQRKQRKLENHINISRLSIENLQVSREILRRKKNWLDRWECGASVSPNNCDGLVTSEQESSIRAINVFPLKPIHTFVIVQLIAFFESLKRVPLLHQQWLIIEIQLQYHVHNRFGVWNKWRLNKILTSFVIFGDSLFAFQSVW